VRNHTSPDDIHGMLVAVASSPKPACHSHAAVVSRELGRAAVVGCAVRRRVTGRKVVTVDRNQGECAKVACSCPLVEDDTPELRELADIARRVSPLRAHVRGDYPHWIAIPRPRCAAPWPAGTATWCPPAALPCWPRYGSAECREPAQMSELAVLQAVRLKAGSAVTIWPRRWRRFRYVVDRLVCEGLLSTVRRCGSARSRGALRDCSPTNARASTR